jgi:hypothetical protein
MFFFYQNDQREKLYSLIKWEVFWMLCVIYGWLLIEVSHKKMLFCLFFFYFFRSTEACFSQCISYSRVFRFEHIYKCSTWSLLFWDMIELNKCCVVEINNSKQKSGARLLTLTVVYYSYTKTDTITTFFAALKYIWYRNM